MIEAEVGVGKDSLGIALPKASEKPVELSNIGSFVVKPAEGPSGLVIAESTAAPAVGSQTKEGILLPPGVSAGKTEEVEAASNAGQNSVEPVPVENKPEFRVTSQSEIEAMGGGASTADKGAEVAQAETPKIEEAKEAKGEAPALPRSELLAAVGGGPVPETSADQTEKQRKEKLATELAQEVNFLLTMGTHTSVDRKKNGSFMSMLQLNKMQKRYYTRELDGIKQEQFLSSNDKSTFKNSLTSIDTDQITGLYRESNTKRAFPGEATVRFVESKLDIQHPGTGAREKTLLVAITLPQNPDSAASDGGKKMGVDAGYFVVDLKREEAKKLFEESLRDPSFLKLFVEKLVAPSNPDFMSDFGDVSSVLLGRRASWESIKLVKDPKHEGNNPLYNYDPLSAFVISDGQEAIVSNVPEPHKILSYETIDDYPPTQLKVKEATFNDFLIVM
jgi:hypothetical protein